MKVKNKRGITLVALVITIMVLLILAGITINLTIGQDGIITTAQEAGIETFIADVKEKIKIDIMNVEAENQGGVTNKKLRNILEKYGTINYEEDDITIKSVTTYEGNYEIAISDIWTGTTVAGAESVDELFDETGDKKGKLHIGDFVNYTAGTWTEEDMTTIAQTGIAPNNSTSKPSGNYQFGGFVVGGSKDGNATPSESSYNYVKDKDTNSAVTGWRVFDVSDGVITLISAGCPEDYKVPDVANSGYISEYILTGNVNGSADATSLGLGTTYTARDWSMYVNTEQGATGASVLSKAKLNTWYSKYVVSGASISDTFEKIYKTSSDCVKNGMYESLIDNYSRYWISGNSTSSGDTLWAVSPSAKCVGLSHGWAWGVRVLVSLSSDVELYDKIAGTKTVVSRENEYTYNVWNLATKQN